MTTISPIKRRILGSLNPNASPCPSSKSEFEGRMEEVQATESSVLPAGCEKDRGEEEPARKRVCLDLRGAQQHQHQQIEAGGHRRNQPRSASPPTEATVLFSKSTTNVSQSTDMEHERVPSLSVLPALHPTRVAAEGTARAVAEVLSVPMATQIAYPAGLVGNFNNHKQPKRTNNPRLRLANQAARQKAEILRLRLSLAAYKIQTGQTDVPLEQLEVRSLLSGEYRHGQRLAGDASAGEAVDNYHDGSNSNPASWSFISNSTSGNSSYSQGHGDVQRVNHLRHAAGAAIEAVQAKQERRTAWREREQYREWYEQYRHHHHLGSTWDHAAEQGHDGFSRDQSRQRQQHGPQQRQRQKGSIGSGRKPLPNDRGGRASWGGSTSTGTGTGAITTATMTTTTTTSPHLNRLDLAERALQAHQRLQSRAVTEELPMEHEHEHDKIDLEQNSLQLTHHHQPQQQQRHRQHLDHGHEGWVVRPTTENDPEVTDDIAEGPGRRDLDDDEEEEIPQSRSRSHQVVGSGSGYSTEPEPEPEPELPALSPFQSHAAASVEHEDQGEGVDEEEGEEEEQGEDGDEAASGLLSLSRG